MITLLIIALVIKLIYDGVVRIWADIQADRIYKIYQEIEKSKTEIGTEESEDCKEDDR